MENRFKSPHVEGRRPAWKREDGTASNDHTQAT